MAGLTSKRTAALVGMTGPKMTTALACLKTIAALGGLTALKMKAALAALTGLKIALMAMPFCWLNWA